MNKPSKALTPAEAGDAVLACVAPLPAERLALRDAAGRILRQVILAERDNPPFDRVCMDGAAIATAAWAAGTRRFGIQATQAAGAVPLRLHDPGAAIEVMTGAVLPHGTDCVIPLEEYDLTAGALTLHEAAQAAPWRNVQRRGSDCATGAAMLAPGMRLGAAELAVVASAGLPSVEVSRLPRIAVLSTGDELIEPGQGVADHQVRRSNAYAIGAALRLHGFTELTDAHVRDDAAALHARLDADLSACDVVILSGGVSKGRFDLVPAALKQLGVQEVFHSVEQRPGRPLWFGTGARGQLVFGLPGNPVSTLVCLHRYVLPALRAASSLAGPARERIALAEGVPARKFTFFMPVELVTDRAGATLAKPRAPHGSGDFLALAGTAGFVELPPRPEGHAPGDGVELYRW
jgi:molybdopterin molybdotransferase